MACPFDAEVSVAQITLGLLCGQRAAQMPPAKFIFVFKLELWEGDYCVLAFGCPATEGCDLESSFDHVTSDGVHFGISVVKEDFPHRIAKVLLTLDLEKHDLCVRSFSWVEICLVKKFEPKLDCFRQLRLQLDHKVRSISLQKHRVV